MNRPAYLFKSLRAIQEHCSDLCALIAVHDDASDPKFNAEYRRAYSRIPNATIKIAPVNIGVAQAKNTLFRMALAADCDYVFICEDDIVVQSSDAMLGYINAIEKAGLHHASFGLHGPANLGGPVEADETITYYPHSVGAWCLYTREVLETVGLFDANMLNSFEHVEWEMRAFQMGYQPNGGAHRFADATGSDKWLAEIPGSIEKSSIRPRPDWAQNIRNSLTYWRDEKPETFEMLFGEGCPLHAYAMSIIG